MKRPPASDAGMELRADLASTHMVRDIEAAIGSGALKPGDRLSSEAGLKEKYSISVGSIRRGMDLLVRKGIVDRRRGSGTYIQALPPPSPAPSYIAADTVLIVMNVHHLPTHPFFGERDRALKSRLNALGWKVEFFGNGQTEAARNHTIWTEVDISQLIRRLDSDHSIAGAIVDRFTVEPVVSAIGERFPCLCLTATELCPFADYRWQQEQAKAIELAVEAGARRLWVISAELQNETVLKRLRFAPASLDVCYHIIPQSLLQTRITRAAFDAVITMLHGQDSPPDGIVMGSEYHAQGVLDALGTMRMDDVRHLRLVAMINKGSRLNTALPVTTVVADGAAAGTAQADLLHQHITMPDHASECVYLNTTVWVAKGWPRPYMSAELPKKEGRELSA